MIKLNSLILDNITVTSDFGMRNLTVNGKKYWWHNGIDLKAKTGDKVYAAADGVVQVAKNNQGGYGLYIVIDHNCFGSLYAHLSKINVQVGQKVKAGDLIGFTGNTGASTGAHLHFEVRECGYRDFWDRCVVDRDVFMRCVDSVPYIKELQQKDNKEEFTVVEAKQIVQEKCSFEDSTMQFLDCYKYADSLFIKIAKAIL